MSEFSIRCHSRPSRLVPRDNELPAAQPTPVSTPKPKPPREAVAGLKARAVDLYRQGKNVRQCAEATGLSYGQAYSAIRKATEKGKAG